MQNIKNVIFDLGGVILDIDYSRTQQAFEALGIDQLQNFITHYHHIKLFTNFDCGHPAEEDFYNEFRKELKASLTNEQIKNAWNAMLIRYVKERIDLLKQLKSKYNIFLFSNTNVIHHRKFHEMYAEEFGKDDFDTLFKKAYYSHLIGMRKPDVSAFEFVINAEKLNPAETLFIDDTLANVEGAKKTGLQTIHLVAPQTMLNIGL